MPQNLEVGMEWLKASASHGNEYAATYPDLCQLIEDDEQGGLRFEIDKHRVSIRLTAPYSEERLKVASTQGKLRQAHSPYQK